MHTHIHTYTHAHYTIFVLYLHIQFTLCLYYLYTCNLLIIYTILQVYAASFSLVYPLVPVSQSVGGMSQQVTLVVER